ncbi:Dos2-interacting transcription regulator of RNA-Pol-II-domain-containing protein [Gorgonomyces haynaldii]|nr:Dos2-interacting transcription regulator of RNA-Pol-II-domain-containing protein [Gorgonomyces haynaldii]
MMTEASQNVLKLVEESESMLTNQDPFERAKGAYLLSRVVQEAQLTPQSATVLLEFFLSRLDDQISVDYLLQGIQTLLEKNYLSKTDQMSIPSRIFVELNVQTFPQQTRMTVFKIFQLLFEKSLVGLQKLGSDFVHGFISSLDGEKDPRNLMLAFQLVKLIVLHLDFEKYCQDLFEVVFCYFPITFKSSPDDPLGVTPEQLKTLLKDCICATPLFGQYAVPQLLEKLQSDVGTAKRDAMDTLAAAMPVYGGSLFVKDMHSIWENLKSEIVSAITPENERSALLCLGALADNLSKAVVLSNQKGTPLELFLQPVLGECMSAFRDVDLKFSKGCDNILNQVTRSCHPACDIVLKTAYPVLFDLVLNGTPGQRKASLEAIVHILDATAHIYQPSTPNHPFKPLKDKSLELLITTLMQAETSPLKKICADGLFVCLKMDKLLLKSEIDIVLQHLTMLALRDDIYKHSQLLLSRISWDHPQLVLSITIPELFEQLNDRSLDTLVYVSINHLILHQVIQQLVKAYQASKTINILETIATILRERHDYEKREKQLTCLPALVDEIVPHLLETEHVSILSVILQLLMRSSGLEDQRKLWNLVQKKQEYQSLVCFARKELIPTEFINTVQDLDPTVLGKICGSLINKHKDTQFAKQLRQKMSINEGQIVVLSWIAKGLVLLADPYGYELSTELLGWIADPKLGHASAQAVEIILKESPDLVLTKEAFATQRPLYKQKFYNHCLPLLSQGYENAKDSQKQHYLMALSYLLRNISSKTLLTEFPKLFPLLLSALEQPDQKLTLGTLETFAIMLKEQQDLVRDHLRVFITRLLDLIVFEQKRNNARVRAQALDLLGPLSKLNTDPSVKHLVLQKIGQSLDDPKRVVRERAAKARSRWFLVN